MKKTLITALIMLVYVSVYAQIGMPRELTCTEEAFNFSVSLGTKWKLGTPKMGPAEITKYQPDYSPAWNLKAPDAMPESYLYPQFELPLSKGDLGYAAYQPNNLLLLYHHGVGFMDRLRFTYTGVSSSPAVNYNLLQKTSY